MVKVAATPFHVVSGDDYNFMTGHRGRAAASGDFSTNIIQSPHSTSDVAGVIFHAELGFELNMFEVCFWQVRLAKRYLKIKPP